MYHKNNQYEKKVLLTKEEGDILRLVETGEFVSVKSKKRDIAYYANRAGETSAKNKTISIRLSEIDLIKLKVMAAQQGLPYQTLISSSLHRLTR